MVTNDLGACEWFVWDLRRSGLIDRGQLDQIVSEFLRRNPRAEAPALAEYLVQQNTLTAFQADRILNGKTQGLVLGPYVLQDAIGQGSMGQVYKATSKNDSGTYAVKVLPRRSMWNVRLARRQVRSFGSFQHPAVVPFVDVGTAGGLHYLTWPLAEGRTLDALVQEQGKLPPAQAALIGLQIAQGLAACHQNNIFHGLLKPSNVMVGEDGQARVLDFGIGSLLVENEGESLVDTMSTANTLTSGLDCASPESIMEPTNRTPAGDQYSLGCTLYYCLTGRVPYPEGSAVEKMMAHQTKEPEPVKEFAPETPDGLVAVVAKLMAKAPEARFAGTDEVAEALEPYLGEYTHQASAPAVGRAAAARIGGSNPGTRGIGASNPGLRGRAATMTPPRGNPGLGGGNTPAGVNRTPAPAAPARPAAVPGRAAVQVPAAAQEAVEVPLTPAGFDPPAFDHPAALRASAGWLNEADSGADTGKRGGGAGLIGIVIAAAVLMGLVFVGVRLLLAK
jgi:serine/threonine-protein kinase